MCWKVIAVGFFVFSCETRNPETHKQSSKNKERKHWPPRNTPKLRESEVKLRCAIELGANLNRPKVDDALVNLRYDMQQNLEIIFDLPRWCQQLSLSCCRFERHLWQLIISNLCNQTSWWLPWFQSLRKEWSSHPHDFRQYFQDDDSPKRAALSLPVPWHKGD